MKTKFDVGNNGVDRTLEDTLSKRPLPKKIPHFSKSFSDVCDERSLEFQESKNVVLWSGGIDSTVAFYALYKNNIPFDVMLTEYSMLEYPSMYKRIQDGYYGNKKVFNLYDACELCENVLEGSIFISGEGGDQTFGTMYLAQFSYEQRQTYYKNILTEECYAQYENSLTPVIDLDNATLAEFLWAINFIFKYDEVFTRMGDGDMPMLKQQIMKHFFDSELFQQWSMKNYKKMLNFINFLNYKQEAKQYIFDINRDEKYFKYKTKILSLRGNR